MKRGLAAIGYRVQGTKYIPRQLLERANLRELTLADIVRRRMFDFGTELTFIQLGAFDGIHHDPLYEYIGRCGWRGIMVEPQPQAAAKLRQLYRDNNRIIIVEAAIDRAPGLRPLFTVESEAAPGWMRGIASFDRDHIVRHSYLIPSLEAMIKEISVKCITFDQLLAKLPGDRVDLLQIDAEGADAFLLSLFPFDRIKPPIVHFESKNIPKAEKETCFGHLLALGYRLAPSGSEDMMALLD